MVDHERGLTEEQVLERIHVNGSSKIILVAGHNRSGSTAIAESLSHIPNTITHFQPIKGIRSAIFGGWLDVPKLELGSSQTEVIKETFGPSTDAEFFNPTQYLSKAGIDNSNIHLIATCRHPYSTYFSWNKVAGTIPSLTDLHRSYNATMEMVQFAKQTGVPFDILPYETFKETAPKQVFHKLLSTLSINSITADALVNWDQLNFDKDDSSIRFYNRKPKDKYIGGLRHSSGFQFQDSYDFGTLDIQTRQSIDDLGTLRIYEELVKLVT